MSDDNNQMPGDNSGVENSEPRQTEPKPKKQNPRSIRNITNNRKNKLNSGTPAFADERRFSSRRYKQAGNKKLLFGLGGLVILFLLFIVVGNVTHRATLELEVANASYSTNETIVLDSSEEFDITTVSVSQGMAVEATDVEEVSVPASGAINVYNTTDESQRLIASTRFAAPNGTEYITPVAITVPGATNGEPGVLRNVRVEANVNGSSANQSVNERMTVPGLVGTDLEGKLYAEAQTEFAGGFEGERLVADESDLEAAESELEDQLTNTFNQLAILQLAESEVLIDRLSELEFSTSQEQSGDDTVTIEVVATAEVVVVPTDVLLSTLAELTNEPIYDGMQITNADTLEFVIIENDENTLEFNLGSTVLATYELDETAIVDALAGLSQTEVEDVLDEEPSIARYDLAVSPFWRNSIPSNTNKIDVMIIGANPTETFQVIDIAEPETDDNETDSEDDVTRIEIDLESEDENSEAEE